VLVIALVVGATSLVFLGFMLGLLFLSGRDR
jgi:hypothetical protein